MVRQSVKENFIGLNKEFRYRGKEQTRIETFSDAVFALVITLLIVSNETPQTFAEMKKFAADVIPFALCMALVTYIWYEHYLFFIRYGFKNAKIVFLNTILLFMILFYVYPLKFLARVLVSIYTSLISSLFGFENNITPLGNMIKGYEMPQLMIIYGLGAALIFGTMILMYRYALKKKEELELNEIELFDTYTSLYVLIIMGSVPLLSVLIAAIFRNPVGGGISGFIYMLYPLAFAIFSPRREKIRKKLLSKNET